MVTASEKNSGLPLVPVLVSLLVYLMISEVAGLHAHVDRFAVKGNIPAWYYWTFQSVFAVGAVLIMIKYAPRTTRDAAKLVLLGACYGYAASLIVFELALVRSLGGVAELIDRSRRLGIGIAISLDVMAPLILLAPVFGIVLFLTYVLLRRLATRRSASVARTRAHD